MRHRVFLGPEGIVGRWGSSRIRASDSALVHLLTAKEVDRAVRAKADGKPPPDGARAVPLSAAGLSHVLAHEEDALQLYAAATDFRRFLDLWNFQPEGGAPRLLGSSLWPSQEQYVAAAKDSPWLFILKARQLGATEIETAWDGYRLRFGPQASRVHLFSLRETEAKELMEQVRFGVERLPEWLRLPLIRETANAVVYDAGADDRRRLHAYPSSKTTSRSSTCTHAHLDEWATMGDPARTMQSVEPTVVPGGTFHILTTAVAPEDEVSAYYRTCEAGEGAHVPLFVGALARPDRDEAWLQGKRRSLSRALFDKEYPTTVEQALSGSGERLFAGEDVDAAGRDFRPPGPAERGRRYVKAWDIGVNDASVGTCLDLTERDGIVDVAEQRRFVGLSYPQIVREIERLHGDYPGPTVVEANAMGLAVIQHLSIPEHQVVAFNTTAISKARMIENLGVYLQSQLLKFDPRAFPQLDHELRAYRRPDDNVVQDTVMSVAIGLDQAPAAFNTGGRVLKILQV